MARLFVAVWPPPDVVATLADLPRPDEPGVRYVPADHLHVTLRFLGSADADEARAALAHAPLPSATAVLGPQVARLGRSVVVVPVAGLDDLAAAVVAATAGVGEPPDPRGFTGHLTVARLRHRGACRIAGAPVRASFPVTEVSLVRSETRAEGPEYEVLERFPVG